MFQRLKGFNLENFLDSKIAEEQARQRNAQQSPSSSAGQRRTPSNARPSNARTDSRSRRPQGGDGDKAPTVKGPDPSEFVIEDDDSLPSRAATPKPPAKDGSDETTVDRAQAANENAPADKDAGSGEKAAEAKAPEELPQDVRLKLRKLEKLESRYHDLLRSYRIAHSRVTAIEPFEAALRENTPLASIADPSALVEYLSQINLKGDMVMQELKRVSGERDELRVKLEEAEKQTKVAYDEAAGLRKERDDAAAEKIKNSDGGATGSDTAQEDADPLGVQKANKEAAADQTQEGKATSKAEEKEKSEDLFSYESEVPRLQAEVQKQSEYINELTTENATLRSDLGTARDSYQKVLDTQEETSRNHQVAKELLEREKVQLENKIETAEREARGIREQLANSTNTSQAEQENMQAQVKILEGELAGAQTKLQDTEKSMRDLSDKAQAAEAAAQSREHELKKQLETLRAEVSDNASDKKRIGTLDNLVKSMKTQLQDAEAATRIAEADLASLRETLSHAEQGRDIAQEALNSKKGHESAVVSLRSQLKKTEKERDDAYQMILNCGKCEIPKQDEQSAPVAGAQDAPGLAASAEENKEDADGAGQGAKKKKKNKNKKKKATGGAQNTPEAAPAETAPAESTNETSRAVVSMGQSEKPVLSDEQRQHIYRHILNSMAHLAQSRDPQSEEQDQRIQHLENLIEEKDAEIKRLSSLIDNKEAAIDRLHGKLKGEEDLREEIESLRDDLMEVGNEHVAAKDQLKQLREQKAATEQEHAEELKQLGDRCASLKTRSAELESLVKDKNEEHERVKQELDDFKKNNKASSKAREDEYAAAIKAEKEALEKANETSKKEIEELKAGHMATNAESDKKYKDLSSEFDKLKSKASSLQTDLSAANELAQTRYKDLTALREHLNKVQPELNSLRNEVKELKDAKEELNTTSTALRKLEAKEKDLRSEISLYKSQLTDKEQEIGTLNDKVKQGNERVSNLEETHSKTQKELQRAEREHNETIAAKDKLLNELSTTRSDLQKARTTLQDLEAQVAKFNREVTQLRDELELKSAQQASAQSLMDSMQDQTRELATQMKETKERCESLEEELADAHRLLSERSREGETMRRLLNDVEGRADARVKDMRERLDVAVEERERAEDEAAQAGRRRSREVEDLKNRLREAERAANAAKEDKEGFERREKEFRSQREELERRAAAAQEEVNEVRSALSQLRDALDEGEKQSRELDKEKTELRRALEDKEMRLASLQKSSKAMAEELRSLQTERKRQPSLQSQSTRTSIDSSRVASPTPSRTRTQNGSIATTGGPDAAPSVDYVYLKNVLLQFLEQKDKKHQMQLVPVLKMLLHFNKEDEQKWTTAISSM